MTWIEPNKYDLSGGRMQPTEKGKSHKVICANIVFLPAAFLTGIWYSQILVVKCSSSSALI